MYHLYLFMVIYCLVVKLLELVFKTVKEEKTVKFSLWLCFSLVQLPDLI